MLYPAPLGICTQVYPGEMNTIDLAPPKTGRHVLRGLYALVQPFNVLIRRAYVMGEGEGDPWIYGPIDAASFHCGARPDGIPAHVELRPRAFSQEEPLRLLLETFGSPACAPFFHGHVVYTED